MTSLLIRLSAVLLSLALISEIGLRTFVLLPASIEANERLGWLYTPGSSVRHSSEGYALHTINSLGLAGDEISTDSGTAAITVLGDSFVESLQLPTDRNFTSRVEQSSRCGGVLNAGRSGISPLHFPALLQHIETAINSRAIVMVVGTGDRNDLVNSKITIEYDANGNIETLDYKPPQPNRLRLQLDPVLRHSALATFLMNRLKAALAPTPQQDSGQTTQSAGEAATANGIPIEKVLAFVLNKTAGNRPAVVLYLPELSYLPNRRAEATEKSQSFASLTQRASRQAGIEFFDTTKALVDLYASSGQPGHGFNNSSATGGHLNDPGHRAVAGELLSALESLGVCGASQPAPRP